MAVPRTTEPLLTVFDWLPHISYSAVIKMLHEHTPASKKSVDMASRGQPSRAYNLHHMTIITGKYSLFPSPQPEKSEKGLVTLKRLDTAT